MLSCRRAHVLAMLSMMLPCYCHAIAMLVIVVLVSCYCPATRYGRAMAIRLPRYGRAMAMRRPRSDRRSHTTAKSSNISGPRMDGFGQGHPRPVSGHGLEPLGPANVPKTSSSHASKDYAAAARTDHLHTQGPDVGGGGGRGLGARQ